MNLLVLNLCLALVWVLLTGTLTLLNLIIGFGIGYFVLLMLRNVFPRARYFRTVPYLIEFLLYFAWELLLANLRVAIDVLTPRHRMHPRVLALPLDVKTDAGITLLANLITLTPGSVSLDVSSDRTMMYLHVMYASDPELVRRTIKEGLERRVIRLLRGIERR